MRYRFGITRAGQDLWVDSPLGSVRLSLLDRLPAPERAAESGSLIAPMPGNVTKIAAVAGDPVTAGQLVLVIEAMKMEHQILAPTAGVLAELRVSPGRPRSTPATCSRSSPTPSNELPDPDRPMRSQAVMITANYPDHCRKVDMIMKTIPVCPIFGGDFSPDVNFRPTLPGKSPSRRNSTCSSWAPGWSCWLTRHLPTWAYVPGHWRRAPPSRGHVIRLHVTHEPAWTRDTHVSD